MPNNQKQIPTDNYFSLLALPVSFNIDRKALNNNYHEVQKSIHPDNYANGSALERRLSVQKAAQVNDALETLKDPLKRSIYLLLLHGIELNEKDNKMDPMFLMEQMELREKLSQLESFDDPLVVLDEIIDDVNSRIKELVTELENLFQKILSDKSNSEVEKLLEQVKSQVLKMQFLNRLQEECLNREEDLANQY
ncbi:MAG: Fe-S protein assembly co-chaperone HscB [gamma proteobacterium symbiont of Taylorina sp.]|nr:Fe-S protein assembly co-chaperone HscB [gamma proteobacterium symbiont of Taylorina sp.]